MSSLNSRPFRPNRNTSPFDTIMETGTDAEGNLVEWWSARDSMTPLGYVRWENLLNVLKKAKSACRNAGEDVSVCFRDSTKAHLATGQNLTDVHMNRGGMYYLAMNGDPDKPEIAAAQRYFIVRTRQAELAAQPTAQPTATPAPPVPAMLPWMRRFRRHVPAAHGRGVPPFPRTLHRGDGHADSHALHGRGDRRSRHGGPRLGPAPTCQSD